MPTLSATDSIAPAIHLTKRQLFQPFRLGHWARMAVILFLTGEFPGGGWGGANFSIPQGGRRGRNDLLQFPAVDVFSAWREYLPWIILGFLAVVGLGFLWMYVASVFRFILLDAVLYNRCELRKGWRRSTQPGTSFFLWSLGFGLVVLVALGALVGGPILLAWQAGVFSHPSEHLLLLILGGLAILFLFLALLITSAVVFVFAKDFVVPIMALENLSTTDAWDRLLPMLRVEKAAYTVYVLMKMVLAMGSAIAFGILNLLVILALAIPMAIAGVALFFIGKAAGLSWNPATIGIVVLLGLAVVAVLVCTISLVDTPALVFFQAYPLYFLGSRYPTLGAHLGLTPPPAVT